jgi:hypothetical protein
MDRLGAALVAVVAVGEVVAAVDVVVRIGVGAVVGIVGVSATGMISDE